MCRDGDGTNGEDVTNSRDSSEGRAEFQHKEYQRELHHLGDLFQEEIESLITSSVYYYCIFFNCCHYSNIFCKYMLSSMLLI